MADQKKIIICIGRQFGSGGKELASALGRKLDIPVYDNELISKAAEESGFSKELFAKTDEKKSLFSVSNFFTYGRFSAADNYVGGNDLFMIQSEVVRKIAENGSAIFIGRCADYILRDMETLSVFITAPIADRISRVSKRRNISEEQAKALITKQDRTRETYYNYFTFGNWGVADNYDMCIDSCLLGIEGTADLIIEVAQKRGLINV